jgi:hypothetical protein
MAAAETVCAVRKPRERLLDRSRRNSHSSASMPSPARANPTSGENTFGITTFSRTPSSLTRIAWFTASPAFSGSSPAG